MAPTRRLAVVYNPMKVEDLEADRRVVAEACRRPEHAAEAADVLS